MGLYESLDAEGRERFEAAYNAAYIPLKHLTEKYMLMFQAVEK